MEVAAVVFRQICMMALMVCAGALLARFSHLDMEGSRQMSVVLTGPVTACVILCSFLDVEASTENLKLLLIAWGLCLTGHLIAIALSGILFRRQTREQKAVSSFALTFTNNGFLGIPLVMAVCGSRGVFFASAGIMISNALTWSYGVSLFQKPGKGVWKQLAKQPTLWAVCIGSAVFLLRLLVPAAETPPAAVQAILSPISSVLSTVAAMNTPLAMIVMGINLYYAGILKAFRTPKCYLLTFLRQLFIPAVMLLILRLIPVYDRDLLLSVLLISSCPCALLTSILAVQYGSARQQTEAAHTVVTATMLAPLTIPVMAWLGSLVLSFA